ncbi:hypothetical protein L873DRAFT_1103080 [Choiromyces venosus 120613-1]|uniref:Uncharacterized protein n=1 Tax=Choiromyces venosus 120613-1 TaxID=1336337 RepID=A0A3N4JVE3_9PEZI|nr:hypothetical protein L873DRAFT_1103080 [Choiromyces venosus 120613-1]
MEDLVLGSSMVLYGMVLGLSIFNSVWTKKKNNNIETRVCMRVKEGGRMRSLQDRIRRGFIICHSVHGIISVCPFLRTSYHLLASAYLLHSTAPAISTIPERNPSSLSLGVTTFHYAVI